jgi:hypothetical protein
MLASSSSHYPVNSRRGDEQSLELPIALLQPTSSPPVFPLPTTAQSSDDHEQSRETDANAPVAKLVNPMTLRQLELGAACKRINVACGESKAELVRRCAGKVYVRLARISHLCTLYEEHGRENIVRSRGQLLGSRMGQKERHFVSSLWLQIPSMPSIFTFYTISRKTDRALTCGAKTHLRWLFACSSMIYRLSLMHLTRPLVSRKMFYPTWRNQLVLKSETGQF